MITLGRHLLVEYFGCSEEILNHLGQIEWHMAKAAETAGATVIGKDFHPFAPHGVSGVVIIQESHLTIHTWPEMQYAAVDIFTCGDEVDPWKAYKYLYDALSAVDSSAMEIKRGPRS